MPSVIFRNVAKSFGGTQAVRGVDVEIADGELFFLLGPSGCGKTTCLRMAAGFEQPDSGAILFGGRDVTGVPPHRRNAGMVFQSYALFPHMPVERNVEFGLRFRSLTPAEKKERTAEAMERTRIAEFAKRLPAQLSGGQQQRVALARALVIRPDVLLLDEPLSNLDAALRAEMRDEIRRIHSELRITSIYVTHDQEDALSMAGRIALMRSGEIVQLGPPQEIYFSPRNSFAASFVGRTNLIPGKSAGPMQGGGAVDTQAGRIVCGAGQTDATQGASLTVSLRPERAHVSLEQPAAAEGLNVLAASVDSVTFLGGASRIELTAQGGIALSAEAPGDSAAALSPGAKVFVSFMAKDAAALEE